MCCLWPQANPAFPGEQIWYRDWRVRSNTHQKRYLSFVELDWNWRQDKKQDRTKTSPGAISVQCCEVETLSSLYQERDHLLFTNSSPGAISVQFSEVTLSSLYQDLLFYKYKFWKYLSSASLYQDLANKYHLLFTNFSELTNLSLVWDCHHFKWILTIIRSLKEVEATKGRK